ncbi:juvenile hormone acid O-methyltransferase [Musca domestica]|uniref:Juvenile hormone acid O-methyltransferase n=1 Tax=Musca domestica TaxID=7370 RepID=A0A1I8M0N7_MUSDO|nr:juvenile hormone acid O-methyltransferase [Musca domestica]
MNRPAQYHQHNEVQRYIADKVWSKYSKWLQWRHDGQDTLLDVGTGTGNVLMEIVKPRIAKTYRKIVGTDVAPEVIEFAQNYYRSPKKCEFRVLNICTEQPLPHDLLGQFDHVTSFNCLHWLKNQEQALRNIYDLIRPEGGDCLLSFAPYVPIMDIYESLRDSATWAPYLGHTDYFNGPLQRIEEFALVKLLQDIGFYNVHVQFNYDVYNYDSPQEFSDQMAASSLFLKHVPASMHEKLMVDFLEVARRLGCRASSACGTKCKFSLNFTNAVVYAKKLPQRR